MRTTVAVLAVAVAVGGGLLAAACGGGRDYDGRGVVRDVQIELGQVLIEHEEIPDLMPAMTMNFTVSDPAILEGLSPGQPVEFLLHHDGSSYRITAIQPVGRIGAAGVSGPTLNDVRDLDEEAPAFELEDQSGGRLALADLRGKAVLLDFIYTQCPGPCPILTGTHVDVQRRLPPELRERTRFVSVTVDPENDTPEALERYATARGADLATWSFLTGSPDEVNAVLSAYGVGTVREPGGALNHIVVTFLIDPEGRIARRYMGMDHEADELLRDVESLL